MASMVGQVALVTGGARGIGLAISSLNINIFWSLAQVRVVISD